MPSTIAIIPARAGSKRVPNKNRRQFLGQNLVAWSINAALACPEIDEVIVSTDDPDILETANRHGVTAYERPAHLATDTASTFSVLKDVAARFEQKSESALEYLVLLQPTSPLRSEGEISRGLAMLRADPEATSLMAVFQSQLFTGRIQEGYWVADYPEDTRSQDLPKLYAPTGSLYVYRCRETLAKGTAWGAKVIPLVIDKNLVVNIDREEDFEALARVFEKDRDRFEYLATSRLPDLKRVSGPSDRSGAAATKSMAG